MNLIGLDANQLDVAIEGLSGILIFYIILDVGSHLNVDALGESLRRILSISGIFLAISFVLLLIYVQLFDKSTAMSTFAVIWIGSLAASLFASWKLYHRMLEHSSLILDRESDVVKIASRQSEEILKPLKAELSAVQKTMHENTCVTWLLAESVTTDGGSVDELEKRLEHTERSLNDLKMDIAFRDEKYQMIVGQYDNWLNEHKDNSEIQTKLAQQAELLLDRLDVFLDLLDLESDLHETSTANKDDTALGPPETQAIEPLDVTSQQIDQSGQKSNHAHKLTREDGLRNREMGNQEQLRFSEYLSLQGKNHKCSLLNGTPDFEFHIDGTIKCIGAFKSMTLSVYGSTKQRWIGKIKLLAEIKTAKKFDVSMILFVRNIANGRIWATVISAENLKEFRGITTPLALVDSDAAAEKACKETLEMALQLV
ncbi:MAG: hypothetical protein KGI19_06890 [Thaumarchaeota archaeon]|nr:hypothetical protein [Nitrososphaerota archaeon]